MITETKLDDSFPTMQFNIEGYHTFRLDRNEYGGGILLYVRDDFPSKFIPMKNSTIKGFFIELNLSKKKWLLCCTYNPSRSFISDHLSTIGNNINVLLANYENFLLMGDLNVEGHNDFLKEFCDLCNLKNIIKVPTCFKNPDFPTSIDVMLTTSSTSFHNSCAIKTRSSDFHTMIVTVMKSHFQKKEPKIIQYRDNNNFYAEEYRQYIISLLSSRELTGSGFDTFMNKCKDACDIRVLIKHKCLRLNQSLFMNKEISKAIMNRTTLKNRFLRTRCIRNKETYKLIKKRNYCVSLTRKTKQQYYNNLDHRKVADNKSSWKYIRPLFSDKSSNSNKITLVERDLILEKNDDIAEAFNDFSLVLFQI